MIINQTIKDSLAARKRELIQTRADYQVEAKFEPRKDIPDLANEEVKFNIASSLVGHEQQQIEEIDRALKRLNNGTYGFCETCYDAINPKRLQAIPEARFCIMCSREQEAQKIPASTARHKYRF